MKKPKRNFPGFFNDWDGTEEYLKEIDWKIPNSVILSLQATFNQNPTSRLTDFFEYWLEKQEYFSKKQNTHTSESAYERLRWYNEDIENKKLAIGLVNVWVTTYLLLKDYENDKTLPKQPKEQVFLFRN